MNIKRIIIPLLLIFFIFSMVTFGAPVYVNVGPTTEFDGDIKILSEIVAEGTTVDGWETTVFFTDPTADRTITIPDYDVTVGSAILLTVTDNENTNEMNAILFTSGGVESGVLNIESDGGDFYYNPSDGSVHAIYFYGDGSNITNIGAASASALTFTGKEENTGNIVKGQPVYISGAAGAAFPLIGLSDCDDSTKIRIIGLAAEAINQNTNGLVRRAGLLTGVDTLGANPVNPNNEAWAAGDLLYVDDTAGGLTNVKPTSGRVIKAAYTLYGSSNTDDLLVVTHENPVYIACAAGEDIDLRMGDSIAANKVLFQDYANNVVGYVDSDGKADFTSLTLDTALLIAEGGTNSAAALTNDRVMVSSGGAIIHSATITVTELGLLNGLSNTIVTDNNACTDIEGTGLSIAGGVLNWACTVNGIDSDNYVDASIDHEHLHNDVIHGMTIATLAAADEFLFWDDTSGALRKITWTNLMGTIGLADLASSTSANLASTLSDETGTLKVVYSDSPTFTTKITVPIIDLTGGQAAFPAAQSASAGANTLDDYEEGTWTPSLEFGGASVDMTYTSQIGEYTKIGRQVTVTMWFQLSAKGTSVGNATIDGLPFTCKNSVGSYSAVTLELTNVSYANVYQGGVQRNTTYTSLTQITEAGVRTSLTNADFADNSAITMTVTYFTD